MNGEALYENTKNSVVRGALTSTNGNTVHVTASGACMYGNDMQPHWTVLMKTLAHTLHLDQ